MKKALLAMMILAGSAMAAPRFAIGIGFGAPVTVVRPACPGPGYVWINGYYGPGGYWVPGFWRAPAVVVAPRYERPHYYGHDFDRHDRDFRHGFRR